MRDKKHRREIPSGMKLTPEMMEQMEAQAHAQGDMVPQVDLKGPIIEYILQRFIQIIVDSPEAKKAFFDPIVEGLTKEFKEKSKMVRDQMAIDPRGNAFVMGGQFAQWREGGLRFIRFFCNEMAGMQLYDLDSSDSKEDKPEGDNGDSPIIQL